MWNRLKRVTPPTGSVVSLAEFRLDRRMDGSDDDTRLQQALDAAIAEIEGPHGIGIVIREQTWQLSLDCFPARGCIELPLGPVQSVDEIAYTDTTGAQKTLTDYQADMATDPARILPAYDDAWPPTRDILSAVKIKFTAGFADGEYPEDLRAAVMLLAAQRYENREPVVIGERVSEVPMAVESILNRYRVGRFG